MAYNLMKLQRHVFGWTGDARWMDAYERALFNCRLGTQNAQGLKQYFFPLAAGYWRAYNSPEESFWCCTVPARRSSRSSPTRFISAAAATSMSTSLSPSTLDWKDESLVLEKLTQFPRRARNDAEDQILTAGGSGLFMCGFRAGRPKMRR